MAVETKQPGLNQTITGMGAVPNGAAAGPAKRKRPSSLLAVANTLPSVENSLEEFIAKANQTLVDVGSWGTDKVKEQEDDKRKELDALRWKAAETQLRESEVRESTLRRQLDNLQGKLAETEARAAVAAESGSFPSASDTLLSDLRLKLARAEEKAASADMRARTLSDSLHEAKLAAGSKPSMDLSETLPGNDDRVRLAEAKAAKALAAARAIQAGLNVSPADLAAIESGLVVPELHEQKKTPWLAIAGAFVVGVAIMFGVTKVVMKDTPAAAPAPAAAAVAPAPAAAPPAATAPAPVAVTPAAPSKPIVTPIEEPKAEEPAPAAAAPVEPAPVAKAPAAPVHHAAPAPVHAAAPAHAAPKAPAAAKKPAAPASNIADPFADPPAKKPAKAAEKKPAAGAIADPF